MYGEGIGRGEGKENKRLETNAVFSMNRFETHQTKGIQITTTGDSNANLIGNPKSFRRQVKRHTLLECKHKVSISSSVSEVEITVVYYCPRNMFFVQPICPNKSHHNRVR